MAMRAPAAIVAEDLKAPGRESLCTSSDGEDDRWTVKLDWAGMSWIAALWFIDQKSPAIPIDKLDWNGESLSLDIEARRPRTMTGKMAPDGNDRQQYAHGQSTTEFR